MKNRIDYYTSTKDFDANNEGYIGYYYWKKFRLYFKRGDQILIRNSASKADYLIKLLEDPELIPESEQNEKYFTQRYRAKYEIIEKDTLTFGKGRHLSNEQKKEVLSKYGNRCPGISMDTISGNSNHILKCGMEFGPTSKPDFDHIIEFGRKGGLSISDNIQPLCKRCHKIKTELIAGEMILALEKNHKR